MAQQWTYILMLSKRNDGNFRVEWRLLILLQACSLCNYWLSESDVVCAGCWVPALVTPQQACILMPSKSLGE